MKLILSINVYLSAYESNLRIEEKILCCILTGILTSSHITGCTISSSIGYEQAQKSEKEEKNHRDTCPLYHRELETAVISIMTFGLTSKKSACFVVPCCGLRRKGFHARAIVKSYSMYPFLFYVT